MIDPEMLAALPFELRVEIAANVARKDFTQSELAEIQRVAIEHWSAARKANQGKRSDLTSTKNFVEVGQVGRTENTTALVAKMFGESEPTVRKRLAIVDAAKSSLSASKVGRGHGRDWQGRPRFQVPEGRARS